MGRYAPDQEEKVSVDIDCPDCKHSFSVDVVVGINKPDVEVEVTDINY